MREALRFVVGTATRLMPSLLAVVPKDAPAIDFSAEAIRQHYASRGDEPGGLAQLTDAALEAAAADYLSTASPWQFYELATRTIVAEACAIQSDPRAR